MPKSEIKPMLVGLAMDIWVLSTLPNLAVCVLGVAILVFGYVWAETRRSVQKQNNRRTVFAVILVIVMPSTGITSPANPYA